MSQLEKISILSPLPKISGFGQYDEQNLDDETDSDLYVHIGVETLSVLNYMSIQVDAVKYEAFVWRPKLKINFFHDLTWLHSE